MVRSPIGPAPLPRPRYMRPGGYPAGHTGDPHKGGGLLGNIFGWNGSPFYDALKTPAMSNMLQDLSYGLMTEPDMGRAFGAAAKQGAAMRPYRDEQQQRQQEIEKQSQMADSYARTIASWGPEYSQIADLVAAGQMEPAKAFETGMKMQMETKAKAAQLETGRRNAVLIQDPEIRHLVESGDLPFAEAYDMDRAGVKAPTIVEIFDEETGLPQKGYMQGEQFVPLGGQKAASNGTNLSFDPETGGFSFSQGGNMPPIAADPTRDQDMLGKKLSTADAKLIEGYREAATVADDLSATIDGLEMVIGNVGYTGPGGELYGAADDLVGVLPGDSGSRGAAKSLAMEAQLAMTAKTKGAITDREMGMFKQAVPGLGQTQEGNQQIIAAMRAMTNRVKTRAAFMEEYGNAKGSMNGAQAAWQAYISDNPVLASGPNGELVVQEEADFTPYLPGGAGGASKGGDEYEEGAIAENPETGETLVYQGGEWVPMQ